MYINNLCKGAMEPIKPIQMSRQVFQYKGLLKLEKGGVLHNPTITYHTYGKLNYQKDNVVWVCHALTANSDAADWWSGLIGPGKVIDPEKYFIVCANILGSCYGTTGPLSTDPETGKPYYHNFPLITVRDMVTAHIALRRHLGIDSIYVGVAGSLGGHQLLEWLIEERDVFQRATLLATSARHSPWGIAFNESQRWAIEQDPSWLNDNEHSGLRGLQLARSIAMLSYRSYAGYHQTQLDKADVSDQFKASSYQRYQGKKLADRFNAYSYWYLSKAMDSHNIARNRSEQINEVLSTIQTPILSLGIRTDLLFPVTEQQYIARHVQRGKFVAIDSLYGHDGFLLEYPSITQHLSAFLKDPVTV